MTRLPRGEMRRPPFREGFGGLDASRGDCDQPGVACVWRSPGCVVAPARVVHAQAARPSNGRVYRLMPAHKVWKGEHALDPTMYQAGCPHCHQPLHTRYGDDVLNP